MSSVNFRNLCSPSVLFRLPGTTPTRSSRSFSDVAASPNRSFCRQAPLPRPVHSRSLTSPLLPILLSRRQAPSHALFTVVLRRRTFTQPVFSPPGSLSHRPHSRSPTSPLLPTLLSRRQAPLTPSSQPLTDVRGSASESPFSPGNHPLLVSAESCNRSRT